MVKRKTTKTLSRVEQLREEAKRAAEYGQTPKRPLSLAPRFRVESRTPTAFSAGSTMLPTYDVAARNDADFQIGVTASALRKTAIDVPAVGALEPKVLREVIRANAELLGRKTATRSCRGCCRRSGRLPLRPRMENTSPPFRSGYRRRCSVPSSSRTSRARKAVRTAVAREATPSAVRPARAMAPSYQRSDAPWY